jgi:hypothetical protein
MGFLEAITDHNPVYVLFSTLAFLFHNGVSIFFAFAVGATLFANAPISIGAVFGWSIAFTAFDALGHLLHLIFALIAMFGYNTEVYKGEAPPALGAFVQSTRTVPYVMKIALSIILYTFIWKQYLVLAGTAPVLVDGVSDMFLLPGTELRGRFTALAALMLYGGVQAARTLITAWPYYLFQGDMGVLSTNIGDAPKLPSEFYVAEERKPMLGMP